MSCRLKLTFALLFCFVFLFYASQFLSSKYSSHVSASQKGKPVHVLIVSSWRSGSSFLGQIFNHHSDVFYFFEPGHSIWMKFKEESSELLHYPLRDLIHSLFTCDVSALQQYLPNGGERFDDLHFFAETQALCVSPACSAFIPSESYDRQSCFQRCKATPLNKMSDACRTYSHVVMKTVRILDLTVLLPLFRDPALDLRIIHLVRDPRAIAYSKKFFPLTNDDKIILKSEGKYKRDNNTVVRVMAKVCRSQVAINEVARTAHALHGRYMAIRLEDLAGKPYESLQKIYTFSGLSMAKDMKQWIYNITHEEKQDSGRFLSFTKMSSNVNQKWRKGMNYNLVTQIQQRCKKAMDLFGYLPVDSIKKQKNMNATLMTNHQHNGV